MHEFLRFIKNYDVNKIVISFSCLYQFLFMAFAQGNYRESPRDIEACLMAIPMKRDSVEIRGSIAKSTISEANEKRDWNIYADFPHIIISQARELYAEDDFGLELNESIYLCTGVDHYRSLPETVSMGNFRKTKAVIKVHTLLDL